ncbi:MAG: YggS family pyridoxal phosphate-dependent enzyme [Saprospiraceae bacterium]|nr:YggS family pyridoxal phosphate-dependent enzyme [Saprospiraceae bacterium]
MIFMTTYQSLIEELKDKEVKLVAVSKTKPVDMIRELYDQGQRIFGENRAQELADKYDKLPQDIEWHMIGHLQKNKVKYIAPFVSMIESCDSLRLLSTINKEGKKNNRIIPVLLQMRIATEETKYGLTLTDIKDLLNSDEYHVLDHIKVCGLMGMATFTDNLDQVRREFKKLKKAFDTIKEIYFMDDTSFKEISMGMSGDYGIAIEEGSTMVRIGSLLFGARG